MLALLTVLAIWLVLRHVSGQLADALFVMRSGACAETSGGLQGVERLATDAGAFSLLAATPLMRCHRFSSFLHLSGHCEGLACHWVVVMQHCIMNLSVYASIQSVAVKRCICSS